MITISRSLRAGVFGVGFAVPILGVLAGCAAPAPRVLSTEPEAAVAGRIDATIIAIRPVPPAAPQGGGAVLAAMGTQNGGGASETEIIVRTDQGNVLSVVQTDVTGLAAGARVVVLTSPRLRIARPGYATPVS
ncbi:hypothetical protein ACELLULO517_24640 [Acidisoma cellulosilytica]|uniref:Uncharacterized protein n=1 Tax=Acidisoma cellulosilyticum TaxID=2802395 RepID=A0A963Z5Z0_9PROT|nr:hypothetical protein [Acidisoma cellulosilyticum]MCB8883459.1 hypothetical protein [Acidisoma cellulosilyticum]